MKKFIIYSLILSCFITAFTGCKKDNSKALIPIVTVNPNAIAPAGFNYFTAHDISIDITLKAPNNEVLKGVPVSFYDPSDVDAGEAIFVGITDETGNLKATVNVPNYLTSLVIDPDYAGIINEVTATITGNNITATIGGSAGFSGNIVSQNVNFEAVDAVGSRLRTNSNTVNTAFNFPTGYTALADATFNTVTNPAKLGVPAYLQPTNDVVSSALLNYVNASLPGSKNLAATHPVYLQNNFSSIINVTGTTDVYVTFVSESARFLNTLAWYSYPTNNPPKTTADIKNATYVFPNASAKGSGGGLVAGNKVKLGTFTAGTSIGYILVQNGFKGTSIDLTSNYLFYSQDNLNPGGTRQAVTLYDNADKLFITGFEDRSRYSDTKKSDSDFNDLVIYTTASQGSALSTANLPYADTGADTDGDGVVDALDAYPSDATRAYNSYFPSQNHYAQLAFEDNWPNKGDYDMNDLVVSYRYTFANNAKNQVVTMQGDYSVTAAGASFKNGFGVQLPVPASAVKSVTGQQAVSNYITFASNGVEAHQTNAVIIPFDNYNALINNPGGGYFINTLSDKSKVTDGATTTVMITLNAPVDKNVLKISALNPFLISNLRRGYEVHLPNYQPTDLATKSLFGTSDDASSPGTGVTYVSKDNWPWAISYTGTFNYPVETNNISLAYPHFLDWANSGGTLYTDWYTNTGAGYRNNSYIYAK